MPKKKRTPQKPAEVAETFPVTHDVDALVDAVRELAIKFPHSLYSPTGEGVCYYTSGSAGLAGCGCIIGQALKRSDPECYAKLLAYESLHDNAIPSYCLLTAEDQETRASDWLSYVQQLQDKCFPWSECVARADARYPQLRSAA